MKDLFRYLFCISLYLLLSQESLANKDIIDVTKLSNEELLKLANQPDMNVKDIPHSIEIGEEPETITVYQCKLGKYRGQNRKNSHDCLEGWSAGETAMFNAYTQQTNQHQIERQLRDLNETQKKQANDAWWADWRQRTSLRY